MRAHNCDWHLYSRGTASTVSAAAGGHAKESIQRGARIPHIPGAWLELPRRPCRAMAFPVRGLLHKRFQSVVQRWHSAGIAETAASEGPRALAAGSIQGFCCSKMRDAASSGLLPQLHRGTHMKFSAANPGVAGGTFWRHLYSPCDDQGRRVRTRLQHKIKSLPNVEGSHLRRAVMACSRVKPMPVRASIAAAGTSSAPPWDPPCAAPGCAAAEPPAAPLD